MKPSRLATRREITLAILVVVLLGLTGSSSQVPAELLPQNPSAPMAGPATSPTTPAASKPSPVRRTNAAPPKSVLPKIPVVDAAPKRPPKIDTSVFPAKLASRDLGISLPVKAVGVTKDGAMEVPDTVQEVGWYRFSSNSSSRVGTIVLASHVDTRKEGLGQFVQLHDAKKGQKVTLVDGSGRKSEYRIAEVAWQDKTKVDWDRVFDRAGSPRLVMITCGGAYDQDDGYRDNVLVTAFPVS